MIEIIVIKIINNPDHYKITRFDSLLNYKL